MDIYKFVKHSKKSMVVTAENGVPGAVVTYKVGEFVSARKRYANAGYHLLAFANREQAMSAADTYNWNGVLWLAKGRDRVTPLPLMLSRENLIYLEKGGKPFRLEGLPWPRCWPHGTVMYKEIKLIRQLTMIASNW